MAFSDYVRNKLIDWYYRGQSFTPPATLYAVLLSAATRTGGTEVTTGGVVRVAITSSLANWAGTQGSGTTSASTGTSGTTSNNADITFVASASAQVSASYIGIYDAATAGNLLDYYQIKDSNGDPITKVWNIGEAIKIAASDLLITWA